MNLRQTVILVILLVVTIACDRGLSLVTKNMNLQWEESESGWQLSEVSLKSGKDDWQSFGRALGSYTFLYAKERPARTNDTTIYTSKGTAFPEEIYTYIPRTWERAISPVSLNTAGEAVVFFPTDVQEKGDTIKFWQQTDKAHLEASWWADNALETIHVRIKLLAKQAGWFSLASPTVSTLPLPELEWGIVPGYFQGKDVQLNLVQSVAYGQGLPDIPYVAQDRTVTTPTAILEDNNKNTLSVIAAPGQTRRLWANDGDKHSHRDSRTGFSHRNRQGELSPTAYIPLLDHPDAQLEVGDSLSATFIYHLGSDGWFPALRLAMDSVYEISKRLALKESTQSLTTRIQRLLQYSLSDQTSFWQKMSFQNQPLGAQSYMGKVVGAEGDATKNSDIGAMWMMAKITDNKELIADRLPLVRNFKLLQQEPDADFFQGAARGQYYLSKSQRWVEEWGSHIEPIGVTYYTLADLSNILLFDPDDVEVRKAVQQGAERLLKWQQEDGSWVIGYDHQSLNPVYTDLQDLRPTFYGLMIAYQMLGEEKYLEAAKKGADWIIENSINKGHFLGVCGDLRFVNDFATAQTAQALLDLWELTEEEKYREAGIKTAKMYVSAIYSHPIASTETRKIRGRNLKGWQYTQAGLGFEHGGSIGSAASHGPILLSSHVGMFVRIAQLTGDRFFADLARAATWGRDAFVNPETGVASYYWVRMDQGAGNFPHHAWWQVGWIMDYLMAEASYRSDGLVHFPAGFMTAKVGPHKPYGFTQGTIGNDSVSLIFHPKTVQGLPPSTDLLMAKSTDNTSCYLILLQNDTEATDLSLQLNLQDILESNNWTSSVWDDEAKTFNPIVENKKKINLSILGAGIRIIKCQQQTS